jgi:hypothetical protein
MVWQLIAGPLFGLIGSGMEKFAEHKQDKLKAEERQKERVHDLAVMEKEASLAIQKTTVEGRIRQGEAEQKTFDESYRFNNDKLLPGDAELTPKQLNWIVAVEVVSKAIRPLSTVWYQVLVAVIFSWSAWKLTNASVEIFSLNEVATLYREVVFSIVGMAETTLLWWYGIRRMSKKKGA